MVLSLYSLLFQAVVFDKGIQKLSCLAFILLSQHLMYHMTANLTQQLLILVKKISSLRPLFEVGRGQVFIEL